MWQKYLRRAKISAETSETRKRYDTCAVGFQKIMVYKLPPGGGGGGGKPYLAPVWKANTLQRHYKSRLIPTLCGNELLLQVSHYSFVVVNDRDKPSHSRIPLQNKTNKHTNNRSSF